MHHLILGYGYCGFYLAKHLLDEHEQVTAVSRHYEPSLALPGLKHIASDLCNLNIAQEADLVIYYLVPPVPARDTDSLLHEFLSKTLLKPMKIVYFGSSAVYGNHQGKWITERSKCRIQHARQLRRLDAEEQWKQFAKKNGAACVLLRIAGIYGPNRLPIEAARTQNPLLIPQQAPYTNHIFVMDLVKIASQLAMKRSAEGIFNIADGHPKKMGALQQLVAHHLDYPAAVFQTWDEIWKTASEMKREIMESSKRLSIELLEHELEQVLQITPMTAGVLKSLALMA
ncbi:NAD-dependent epimerase/dehydratase [Legionella birminghamensis]|uniref:NAD-dependent epimerase/dehydratase n=1 Tax=Legionella birminghamensis TaxID=28083 RepID=A0A378IJZ8_9GAMM|nr:NAD-dependent epimerase/dehydratase family protein [Legionella birminghamensis]KTC71688.1 NAD-dependent epimerase/dehydratase [Legionella birminghamensis]STX32474.1 oxidoreductase (NAD-dependent epimerase/dehydratase) [Legionella birminghamensis]